MAYIEEKLRQEVIEHRRYLHKIPELGYEEAKTSEYIRRVLKSYGYKVESVAGTGVMGFRKGIGASDKTIAYRADMDGLEIEEATKLDYSSRHQGKMHACGHDGHMAILLGFAKYISMLEHIDKNLLLIFQPAEEGPGGAKAIVETGVFERYEVEAIFGLHIHPSLEEGKLGLKYGPIMARCGSIDIEVHGRGGHGAMPEKGIDAIYVSSQLINSYQSIISRNVEPSEGGVLSIGTIRGGEARNILAESVSMSGTIRAFRDKTYDTIVSRIADINEGIEKVYGVKVESVVRDMYPAVTNDFSLYNRLVESFDERDIEPLRPMMIAEDFSYYQRAVPGFFFILGSRNYEKGYSYPLHNCKFNFDEKVLCKGIESFIQIGEAMELILD